MAVSGAKAGEDYTIRQKVIKILGSAFHIYNADGVVVGYCKQKAFRFREAFKFYTDQTCAEVLFEIGTSNIIDLAATYGVKMPDGTEIGSFRRKAMKSFLRDTWELYGPSGALVGTMQEDSQGMALLRRFVPFGNVFSPQVLHVIDESGRELATFRKHFNLVVHRMGVTVHADDHPELDDLLLLAAGCVYMAIDSRQDNHG